jgi:hypothetical protein
MNKEQLQQEILEFIEKNPQVYEDAFLKLDEIFESAMQDYEVSESRIRQEIIDDPRAIENPEQEFLDRMTQERNRIKRETLEKAQALQASYEKLDTEA